MVGRLWVARVGWGCYFVLVKLFLIMFIKVRELEFLCGMLRGWIATGRLLI